MGYTVTLNRPDKARPPQPRRESSRQQLGDALGAMVKVCVRIMRTIASEHFEVPSTVAVKRNVLAAVNARFGLGLPLPFSTEAPPGTPFEVVTVRRQSLADNHRQAAAWR
jgi:hypothetical protein